jgi:purine-nucleoside phosphorylase
MEHDAPYVQRGWSIMLLENINQSADFIKSKIGYLPEIAVILGSGLGDFSKYIENPISFPYSSIPNFPVSTVATHAGKLYVGQVCRKSILVMSGRFHYYEGYSFEQTAYPIRVMKQLGIKKLIVTNAAGGINETFKPGDIMLISDHIKFAIDSPCRGENISALGSRFFDMTSVYSPKLRDIASQAARELKLDIKEGVYAFMAGPQFETPAEIRALRCLGADAVGMSTVAEVIEAVHSSIEVLGISCISNYAAGISKNPITDEEVIEVTSKIGKTFCQFLLSILKRI